MGDIISIETKASRPFRPGNSNATSAVFSRARNLCIDLSLEKYLKAEICFIPSIFIIGTNA
jgi:hypothetical protein